MGLSATSHFKMKTVKTTNKKISDECICNNVSLVEPSKLMLNKTQRLSRSFPFNAPDLYFLSIFLTILYIRGAQSCSWRSTVLHSSSPTLIKHT